MISVASALASAANRRFGAAWTAGQTAGAELPAGLPTSFVEVRAAGLAPVTVAYERQGYGEPLILLHGVGHHRRAWDAVVPLLTEHETIAMDLPGFGESPDLGRAVPRDLETAVVWMGAVFDALGLTRPHVVGHSLGGLIALRLGQAGLARSVTAVAPAGFWNNAERRYAYAVLTMARHGARLLPETGTGMPWPTVRAGRRQAPADGLARPIAPAEPPAPPTPAVDLRALREPGAFRATLRAGRAQGLFSGDIPDIPVTIAWGTRDRLLPPRQAARAKAMIPGARLVAMPGCGHVPMAEAPELVARVLRDATSTENRSQQVRSTAGRAGTELTARAWPTASGNPA
ncbi:alpha/beta fold hydrolase [Streptomyces flavidovirens]|uniref:alpha/beta fold hydrolase n=1 Tax=Streptomyces flavidovirens TaxID=67298 RepID=UPI0036CA5085